MLDLGGCLQVKIEPFAWTNFSNLSIFIDSRNIINPFAGTMVKTMVAKYYQIRFWYILEGFGIETIEKV
jgi:hypothetical protein